MILRCVKENGDRYVTIRQIAEYLEDSGIKVGLTTIYRTVGKLLKEGRIAGVSIDGVSGKCYRYLVNPGGWFTVAGLALTISGLWLSGSR